MGNSGEMEATNPRSRKSSLARGGKAALDDVNEEEEEDNLPFSEY